MGFFVLPVFAQDPALPPTNLGMANMMDGVAGPPGLVFANYTQIYRTRRIMDGNGQALPTDLKINSIASINQLIYLTRIRFAGGNLAFTVIIPITQLTAEGSGPKPTVNPGVLGDPAIGIAVQWSDKKLFKHKFFHRFETTPTLPLGSYRSGYDINTSSHLYGLSAYHAFTFYFNNQFSLSGRNQINFNSHTLGTPEHAGTFYNGNYSLEHNITKSLRAELIGYYLTQIGEDSYQGDHGYFTGLQAVITSQERIMGYGPGLAILLNRGIMIEGKVLFENLARNRTEGMKSVLRIAIPLNL